MGRETASFWMFGWGSNLPYPSSAVCGKFFVSRPGMGTCFRLPHQTPTLKWSEQKNRGFHFFTKSHGSRFHPRSPKTLIFSVFLMPLMAPKLISQTPISVNSGSPDWDKGREILEYQTSHVLWHLALRRTI